MALSWPFKDPEEVLDYTIDWAARLAGDVIIASGWSVVDGTGIVMDSDNFSSSKTVLWLSSGVLGTVYLLTNHITTLGGRQMEMSVKLKIKHK